jgi:hypothetical protein
VDEEVLAGVVGGDEAEPLVDVEPLHGPGHPLLRHISSRRRPDTHENPPLKP